MLEEMVELVKSCDGCLRSLAAPSSISAMLRDGGMRVGRDNERVGQKSLTGGQPCCCRRVAVVERRRLDVKLRAKFK